MVSKNLGHRKRLRTTRGSLVKLYKWNFVFGMDDGSQVKAVVKAENREQAMGKAIERYRINEHRVSTVTG